MTPHIGDYDIIYHNSRKHLPLPLLELLNDLSILHNVQILSKFCDLDPNLAEVYFDIRLNIEEKKEFLKLTYYLPRNFCLLANDRTGNLELLLVKIEFLEQLVFVSENTAFDLGFSKSNPTFIFIVLIIFLSILVHVLQFLLIIHRLFFGFFDHWLRIVGNNIGARIQLFEHSFDYWGSVLAIWDILVLVWAAGGGPWSQVQTWRILYLTGIVFVNLIMLHRVTDTLDVERTSHSSLWTHIGIGFNKTTQKLHFLSKNTALRNRVIAL